jgi:hypothetical protein
LEFPDLTIPAVPEFPSDYPAATFDPNVSLQDNIDNAAEGSLLVIPAKDYEESIKVHKNLYLKADGEVIVSSDKHGDSVEVTSEGSTTTVAYFEGIVFTQAESQSASAGALKAAEAIFKNCTFHANFRSAVTLRAESKAYFIGCSVTSDQESAASVQNAAFIAEQCKFTATNTQKAAIDVIGDDSIARMSECSIENKDSIGFIVRGAPQYLIENAVVDYPLKLSSLTTRGVLRNCTFSSVPLVVERGGRPYICGCTFSNVGLECDGLSGVRIVDTKFLDAVKQPSLLVHAQSTVEANRCNFSGANVAAAVVVCERGKIKLADCAFSRLAGSAVFATGPDVKLEVEHTGFARIGNSAIVTEGGAELVVANSFVSTVRGTGLLVAGGGKVEIERSKFAKCQAAGAEIRQGDKDGVQLEASIKSSIFEDNGYSGLLAIDGTLTVEDSDFAGNSLSGVERRGGTSTITKSYGQNNGHNGFLFFDEAKAEITGGGVGANNAVGLAAYGKAVVTVKELELVENGAGVLAAGGSSVTIEESTVKQHLDIGIRVHGEGTKLALKGGEVSGNGVGLQAGESASVAIEGGTYEKNGIQIQATLGARLAVKGATFTESINGIGVFVTNGADGSFDECKFLHEGRAGLATAEDASVLLSNSEIIDCLICGLFLTGKANGKINDNKVLNNGSCGIQIMGGNAEVNGNTIEGHTTFGIYVASGATFQDGNNNQFGQNSVADLQQDT